MKSIYETLTAKIIDQMETHGTGWTKQWVSLGGAPQSISTGKAYTGINRLILGLSGHSDPRWGTYKAWAEKGCQVRKGEKATHALFFKAWETRDKATDEMVSIPLARSFAVFNAEQVDGADLPELTPTDLVDDVESFIAKTGAVIRHGGDQACYMPSTDIIKCPLPEQFVSTEAYYAVLLHELSHWTGHKSRLDRQIANRFGSEDYAKEELIAEIASAFLCCDLGITSTPRDDHAQYLSSWLKVLRSDSRAIYTAARQAQAAAEFLHRTQEVLESAA